MERFRSRKFWIAVGAFVTAAASGEWGAAVSIVLGYLGVQGAADFKGASE